MEAKVLQNVSIRTGSRYITIQGYIPRDANHVFRGQLRGKEVGDNLLSLLEELDNLVNRFHDAVLLDAIAATKEESTRYT